MLQEQDGSHHHEATEEQHQPDREGSWDSEDTGRERTKEGEGKTILLTMLNQCYQFKPLTSVSYRVHLTAAVHSHTQHGCLVVPFEALAFGSVRQESQIGHHNAVALLHIVQLLQRQ